MNEDLNDLLDEERFTPFSITTRSGFSMAIGPEQRKHMVIGARMLVTMYDNGRLFISRIVQLIISGR